MSLNRAPAPETYIINETEGRGLLTGVARVYRCSSLSMTISVPNQTYASHERRTKQVSWGRILLAAAGLCFTSAFGDTLPWRRYIFLNVCWALAWRGIVYWVPSTVSLRQNNRNNLVQYFAAHIYIYERQTSSYCITYAIVACLPLRRPTGSSILSNITSTSWCASRRTFMPTSTVPRNKFWPYTLNSY